ncbi:hypothetical protein JOM56_014658 [Amanita muscaria]
MVHHVYHEVTPDVFTNTRLSSMLDTSKPSQDIIADPESKHTSLPALAVIVWPFISHQPR